MILHEWFGKEECLDRFYKALKGNSVPRSSFAAGSFAAGSLNLTADCFTL